MAPSILPFFFLESSFDRIFFLESSFDRRWAWDGVHEAGESTYLACALKDDELQVKPRAEAT